jgi:CheY-like chemotaxis protein
VTSCLVIDDDALVRRMAMDILIDHGCSVREAATGRQGLDLFRAEPVDVVLLDLVLPDISGNDLLPKLVNDPATCRVIVMTAFISLESVLQVLRLGASDYLPKPFSQETLVMSIERVMHTLTLEREKRELSRRLEQRLHDLSVLNRISGLITSKKPLDVCMNEVLQAASAYLGAEYGSLLLLDSAKDELMFYVTTGPNDALVRAVCLPRGRGIAWWCFQNRKPIKVDNAYDDPRFDQSVDARTGLVTRSILAAPIEVRSECIGVIELINTAGAKHFSDDDLKRLEELSGHLAVAVQNALTVRDLNRSREELLTWSQKLERMVEERTRELWEANQARQAAYHDLERTHNVMKRAQGALVERETMAALGLLVAGMTHEINNPLGFVNADLAVLEQYLGSLRRLANIMMRAPYDGRADEQEHSQQVLAEAQRVTEEEHLNEITDDFEPLLSEMKDGLARITRFVEQLRSFTEEGAEHGQVGLVDLNSEVTRLFEIVQGAGSSVPEVHYELAEVPCLQLSVKTLRQVLLNLFGRMVSNIGIQHRLLVSTRMEDEKVVLRLVDTARQVTAQELEQLFEPLYAVRDDREGDGVGLFAVAELAAGMGGSLRASQWPAGGMCLELTLPVRSQTAELQKGVVSL